MQNDIVVIGANSHIEPLINKVKGSGYKAHVFAWKTGEKGELAADVFYPVSILDKERILEECNKISPAAVVTLGSDMTALTVAFVSEKLGLPGKGYSVVKNATNKLTMRRILDKHNIPQPKFIGIDKSGAYMDSRGIDFPVVVKPTDRSGGRAVKRANNRIDVIKAVSAAKDMSFEKKAIVEEYILGRHYSCECISCDGNHHILAYTHRKNLERYTSFKEHIHLQPARYTKGMREKVESLVYATLDALEISSGSSSVEFVIDRDNQIKIIEVSACMYGDYIASHMVPYTTGQDYMGMELQIALGRKIECLERELNRTAETHFVLQYSDLEQYQEYIKNSDCKILFEDISRQIDQPPKIPDGTIYGCYIIGWG